MKSHFSGMSMSCKQRSRSRSRSRCQAGWENRIDARTTGRDEVSARGGAAGDDGPGRDTAAANQTFSPRLAAGATRIPGWQCVSSDVDVSRAAEEAQKLRRDSNYRGWGVRGALTGSLCVLHLRLANSLSI